jgi:N-acylglucosamine-6-phosphate 2-epimerase
VAIGVNALERMRGGLVVSVQAPPASPLRAPAHMAAVAQAAEAGGAVGIRAAGAADIAAIKAAVGLPVIGLHKRHTAAGVRITPTFEDAEAVVAAGADVLAVDATLRPRADGRPASEFVAALRASLGVPVLADVDDAASGTAAARAGAAAVATTLAGYTGGPSPWEPDIALVAELTGAQDGPVIAEGRYATAAHVSAAFAAGAYAVVVGTAITDPVALTRGLAAATPAGGSGG